ncbi:hypothetical protein V1478_011459, partial [Vespula squamosa]
RDPDAFHRQISVPSNSEGQVRELTSTLILSNFRVNSFIKCEFEIRYRYKPVIQKTAKMADFGRMCRFT